MSGTKFISHGLRHVWKDQYGIIGQPYLNGVEGGDSASWNGHYNYFREGSEDKVDYVKTFEVGFGSYVRHPHPDPVYNRYGSYYKHPWDGNISRDQLTGVLAGNIAAKNKMPMVRLFLHCATRGFILAYNNRKNGEPPETAPWKLGDFLGPNMWATFIRALGPLAWAFWPVLIVLDLHILIDTLIANRTTKDDGINYLFKLHLSRNVAPTPTSWLAVKVLDKEHLRGRLKAYWTGWRDNPGMFDLHSKAISELE